MKSLFTFILLTGITTTLFSQGIKNGRISVEIFNRQSVPLENTTVELLRSKDSALVKTAISDKSGTAVLEKLLPGTYIIKASIVNYEAGYSPLVTLTETQNDIKVPAISLQQRSGELKELHAETHAERSSRCQRSRAGCA